MAAVRWNTSPSRIGREILRRSNLVRAALGELGESHAARAEAAMKAQAPWNDQTGNARQGLFGQVEVTGDSITITLGHTVIYGVFLELGTSRMVPRPVIVPVASQTAEQFIADAVKVVRGAFG